MLVRRPYLVRIEGGELIPLGAHVGPGVPPPRPFTDMTLRDKLKQLEEQRRQSEGLGGGQRIEAQHERGKLTARERLDLLLDEGTLRRAGPLRHAPRHRASAWRTQKYLGDGVVTGYGTIDGRLVYVFSQDFTVFGGSLSEAHAEKIVKIMDLALKTGAPVIGLNDSGGARIQEGVVSLGGYADIFLRNTLASGVIPQISAILGPCAGGAVYSPAITDFIYMVRGTSYMFVTGPNVVKTVTHEDVDMEGLGGADVHAASPASRTSPCDSELECLHGDPRAASTYIPQNNLEDPPRRETERPVRPRGRGAARHRAGRARPSRTTCTTVIRRVVDDGEFSRCTPTSRGTSSSASRTWAGTRWASWPTSRPCWPACSTSTARSRARASCASATAFNIPLVVFEDVPGFLPGVAQEHGGIIRHGAKLLYAFCEATVPQLTVITRKAYGGAYDVMNSKHIRGDVNLAWPTAEIAVMGPKGAVEILFRERDRRGRGPEARRRAARGRSTASGSRTRTWRRRAATWTT